jgi:hypothetical protein
MVNWIMVNWIMVNWIMVNWIMVNWIMVNSWTRATDAGTGRKAGAFMRGDEYSNGPPPGETSPRLRHRKSAAGRRPQASAE